MNKNGIDISHHQGNIDFEKLKGNIDFAMVRTSYGNFNIDKKYKENINGLNKINVPYGLYHFSYATNVKEAKEEVEAFLNLIKEYKPLYPVVVDIESSTRTENVKKDTLVDIASAFCKKLEENGYYAMIYANLNYFDTKLNSSKLNKYDKWVAEWKDKFTYKKEAGMWQYSSNGNMPGINGDVDLDISFKDYPKIIKESNLNNYNEISDDTPVPSKYIVQKGDNLTKIAKKYNTTWQNIYNKNKDVIGNNPNKIKPGQVLTI